MACDLNVMPDWYWFTWYGMVYGLISGTVKNFVV
jgi:hypothetical protein